MTGQAPAPQPKKIGRYDIQDIVGRGSMGVVYRARDTVLGCTVALKTVSLGFSVPHGERQTYEKRFVEEAQAVASLSHPGVVEVYDVGKDSDTETLFMALEFLRGKTLESLVAAGRAPDWHTALEMVARIADALHHAHGQGIIHRDVKPANIMVLASGDVKLMDFGVAKLETGDLSVAGQVFGSPAYMSPQQAFGERLDGRTDVFSLGAVLYELLTGKRAFCGENVTQILMKVAYQQPVPPSGLVSTLPRAIDTVLAMALAKKAEDRYRDAGAFREDLDDLRQARLPRHARPSGSDASDPPTLVLKSKSVPRPARTRTVALPPTAQELGLPAGKRVSLAVRPDGRTGETLILKKPKTVIGRSGGGMNADVELSDPQASRTHLAVECYGMRVILRDLGSTNGTFVNGERISEVEIGNGAEFRVGRTLLKLLISDAE